MSTAMGWARPRGRGRYRGRVGLLALALLLALGILAPLGANAQAATRRLRINQVHSTEWPAVTINFSLRSLDDTPLGDIQAGQFEVEENGASQTVTQLVA